MCCQDCEQIPVQTTSLVWWLLSKWKGWSSVGQLLTVNGHVAAGCLSASCPNQNHAIFWFLYPLKPPVSPLILRQTTHTAEVR